MKADFEFVIFCRSCHDFIKPHDRPQFCHCQKTGAQIFRDGEIEYWGGQAVPLRYNSDLMRSVAGGYVLKSNPEIGRGIVFATPVTDEAKGLKLIKHPACLKLDARAMKLLDTLNPHGAQTLAELADKLGIKNGVTHNKAVNSLVGSGLALPEEQGDEPGDGEWAYKLSELGKFVLREATR